MNCFNYETHSCACHSSYMISIEKKRVLYYNSYVYCMSYNKWFNEEII